MTRIKVAIVEIGGSHDECILSQLIALKERNCYVAFCGTIEVYERNSKFAELFNEFYEVKFPKTMMGDFKTMKKLNKWFMLNDITKVIANTAQGGHIRNLALTSYRKTTFYGIVHTIKMFDGSFTQGLISRKIKNYFVLNDTLLERIPDKNGLSIHSFYPLDYPQFDLEIKKQANECWITIIGGVETRRKDLKGFISIAKAAPANVKFIFLGKTDKERQDSIDFQLALEKASLVDKVILFHEFINQEIFNAYLNKTDGILPLVHPNTPSADEYFSRQISGAINVAFSYKTPLFIHDEYSTWDDFNSGVQFYNLENNAEAFLMFLSKLTQLRKEIESNPKFSKLLQQERFANIILGD